jgi:hypothetical protein
MESPAACPACGYKTDVVRVMDPDMPSEPHPGAIFLCAGCGEVRIFGDDGSLRLPDESEEQLLKEDPLILSLQRHAATIREFKAWCKDNFNDNPNMYAWNLFLKKKAEAEADE